MSDQFDPYYTWLGIPPEEQPPDFYRLLGIRRFENNSEVISNALDQRRLHLRSFQSGQHAAESQRLLNELSRAGACLENPEKKGAYDRELRQKDAPKVSKSSGTQPALKPPGPSKSGVAAPVATAVPASRPPVLPPAVQVAPQPVVTPGEPFQAQSSPGNSFLQPLVILALGGLALVVLGALALVGTYFGAQMLAKKDPPAAPRSENQNPSPKQPTTKQPRPPSPLNQQSKTPPQFSGASIMPSPPPPISSGLPSLVPRPETPPFGAESVVQPGEHGFALRLSGADYVELANTEKTSSWNVTGTAEIWIRWDRGPGEQRLMGTWLNAPTNRRGDSADGWALSISNLGSRSQLLHSYAPGSSRVRRQSQANVGGGIPWDDRWHHFAYAHDTSSLDIFIDGKPARHTIKWPPPQVNDVRNLHLGPPQGSRATDLGREIAAFRLSSNKRYTTEFTPPATFEKDAATVVLLDFSQGQGDTVPDLSGLGHDGRISGAKWVPANSKPGQFVTASGAIDKPTDLLARFNPTTDVPRGAVTKDAQGAITSGANRGFEAAVFPAELPEEYVLETEVMLLGKSDGLIQGLVAGGRQFEVTVDGFGTSPGGMRTAIETIDGRRPHDAPSYPCELRGTLLTKDKPTKLNYYVYKDKIVVECDGKTVLTWTGGVNRLGMHGIFNVNNPKALFWGAWNTPFRLSKFEVRPIPSDSTPPPTTIAGTSDPAKPPSSDPLVNPSAPTARAASNKLAKPETAEQEVARAQVQDLYRQKFAKAKAGKAADKSALASELLIVAKDEKGKPAERYVLYDEARNLMFEAGDLDGAFALVDRVNALFDLDPTKEKISALKQAVEASDSASERRRLTEIALYEGEAALSAANFEVAKEAVRVAVSSASRVGDNRLRSAATKLEAVLAPAEKQHEQALEAFEKLKAEPDDAGANLAWGRFVGLIKRDWKEGLAHLAKGSDPELKAAAELERALPAEADKIAKAWDELSEAHTGREKESLLLRAREWYQKSLATSGELSKQVAQKRLDEISALLPAGAGSLSVKPPPKIAGAVPGMIGRAKVRGKDAGVVLKYETGAQIVHEKLVEELGKYNVSGTSYAVELWGVLHVPEQTKIEVVTSTGGKFVAFADLKIQGKPVQDYPAQRRGEAYEISLPKGEYPLFWNVHGSHLGIGELTFTDAETGQPLYVYYNQLIGKQVASFGSRGEISFSK